MNLTLVMGLLPYPSLNACIPKSCETLHRLYFLVAQHERLINLTSSLFAELIVPNMRKYSGIFIILPEMGTVLEAEGTIMDILVFQILVYIDPLGVNSVIEAGRCRPDQRPPVASDLAWNNLI